MPEFAGLTDDEKDRLRDWWDEETTVGVESVFPEVARIVIARMAGAWDEGARRGYALYDMKFAYVQRDNPYRVTEETP